jgi:CRP-like cAMP-binding protein
VTRAPVEELVAGAPLWAALPAVARRELLARATRRRFRRGQRLLGVGDRALVTLVVGRGELRAGDDDAVIRSLVAPATIGVSLALGAPPSAELWATDDGVLVAVPGEALAATLRRHPEAAIAALVHLAGVVAELSATALAMRRHGLAARLRHRLLELARGRRELAITHAALAAEVGGTRANVSRALARLEAEGWLRRHRGRLELRR